MIGLTIITQLVYWYRDLKTPGSDETELREIIKVERKEKKVPKSQALTTIKFLKPNEQPWTDREDFGFNAYDNMQDNQERQNDDEPKFSERSAVNYSDVRKCNAKDIGSGFQESPNSNSNYSAVRNPKPTECQPYYSGPSYSGQSYCSGQSYSGESYYNGSSYTGQSYCSGSSYSGQSYCSGPSYSGESYYNGSSYTGQSYCSGSSYSGQSYCSGPSYSGLSYCSGSRYSGSSIENPDWMEWDSFDSGVRYSDRQEWIGNEFSYSDHAGISEPLTHYSEHAGIRPVPSYSKPSYVKDTNEDERRQGWESNEIDYMGQDSF